MKDVCLCIVKSQNIIHSVGINKEGKYYSDEGGGYFDLNHNRDVFDYQEFTWKELRSFLNKGL